MRSAESYATTSRRAGPRRRRLAWIALAGVLVVAPATVPADEGGGSSASGADLRKEIPRLIPDVKALEARIRSVGEASDEELELDEERAERLHAEVSRKLRKVERTQEAVSLRDGAALRALPQATLALADLEEERARKLEALEQRAQAERQGAGFDSAEDPGWIRSPQGRAIEAERARLGAELRHAFDEHRRAYGAEQSEEARTLERLRQEAVDELSHADWLRLAVRNEGRRRRGEPLEPDLRADEAARTEEERRAAKEEREIAEEHRRLVLRVEPVRTEYTVRPREAATVMFQVYRGRPPYMLSLRAGQAGGGYVDVEQPLPGEFQFPLTYEEPGVYQARFRATDYDWVSRSVAVTIRVEGEPVEVPAEEKSAVEAPGDDGDDYADDGPVVPLPLEGTFDAMIWHAHAELVRWDLPNIVDDPNQLFTFQGVPIQLTLEPGGRMRGAVRYELPASEMHKRPPGDGHVMYNMFWKVSFDLEGTVDWATGQTVISIKNGHDETGYEKDPPKTDGAGNVVGTIGHWRDWRKIDYHASLEGWTIPGPQSAAWLESVAKNPQMRAKLQSFDLEKMGLPSLLVSDEGVAAFRDRGFFGTHRLDGSPAPDGLVPRRITCTRNLAHRGYDGVNETEQDEAAATQRQHDDDAKAGRGMWYIKLIGLAAPPPPAKPQPSTPSSPKSKPKAPPKPKDDDLLAFGLWPVKPVETAVGGETKARAMGVLGKDVYDAVDLSAAATWTSSPGITHLGGGVFRADKPGTYTVTATHAGPDGPMTSTLTIVAK